MSSEIGLVARGLGKRYDLFGNSAAALARQFVDLTPARQHWALRGVDLDVAAGSCLGIIGRNGSGKSTLLSLIAGIQQPSAGSVEVRGRVAALLELGAGFHPDFTGRENVRMSAALYGLPERLLEQRFDEIEAFAGIGDFIDRPVLEYSSGMYARLAFAVAAHVDADILIVDEILGVGDIRFQQRCARFIRAFRERGIVLLVSHSEETVLSLCDQAIWLADGVVKAQGAPREVARAYHAAVQLEQTGAEETHVPAAAGPLAADAPAPERRDDDWSFDQLPAQGSGGTIGAVALQVDGRPASSLVGGETATLSIVYDAGPARAPVIGFIFRDRLGNAVLGADSSEIDGAAVLPPKGVAQFAVALPFMTSGDYTIEVALLSRMEDGWHCLARRPDAAVVQVLSRHISSGMGSVAQAGAQILINGAEAVA